MTLVLTHFGTQRSKINFKLFNTNMRSWHFIVLKSCYQGVSWTTANLRIFCVHIMHLWFSLHNRLPTALRGKKFFFAQITPSCWNIFKAYHCYHWAKGFNCGDIKNVHNNTREKQTYFSYSCLVVLIPSGDVCKLHSDDRCFQVLFCWTNDLSMFSLKYAALIE